LVGWFVSYTVNDAFLTFTVLQTVCVFNCH